MSGCLGTTAGEVPGMCGFQEDMRFRLALVWSGSLLAGFNGMVPGYLSQGSGVRSVPASTIANRWKAELHLKTTTLQVLGCDRSTVQRCNSFTDGEAQTCATLLVRALRGDSKERIKDLLQSLVRHTGAFICRGDGDHRVSELGDISNIYFHNSGSGRMF